MGPGAGVSLMAYYRLYLLSSPGGRFVGFEEYDAADDVEAVRMAEDHPGPQARELWCGKRKVRAFPEKASREGSVSPGARTAAGSAP